MPGSSRVGPRNFQPTRWSVVLAAGDSVDVAGRRPALEQLAAVYWPPLYGYLRRDGHPAHKAEDLVQAFFTRLIEKNDLRLVDRSKGNFRSFVLAALKNFVLNERAKELALKRGGGVRTVSIDATEAETRYGLEPIDRRTPEDVFNRRWALTVLDTAMERLRQEHLERDQVELFDAMKQTLTGDATDGYAAIGQRLGISEGAARVASHRLRKRYRELVRGEVAQTVADPSLVEEEMQDLLACLART